MVAGEVIPSWGNPKNYLLVLLQGFLIRSLYLQARSNLLCLQNQLKGPNSGVGRGQGHWGSPSLHLLYMVLQHDFPLPLCVSRKQ